jgi:hypothetical protein
VSTKKRHPTRAELARRLRSFADDVEKLDTHDLRLAADVLRATAYPVEFFELRQHANERVAWTEAMVTALNALGRHWNSGSKWWLCAVQRAELEAQEAKRIPDQVLAP